MQSGIDQVNTAVSQIDVVTQTNAARTEEIAGTARKLAADAQLLMRAAEHFLLPELGALRAHASGVPELTMARRKVA